MTTSQAEHCMTYHRACVARCPTCGQTWARAWWGAHAVAVATGEPWGMVFPDSEGWFACCTKRWAFRWE